MSLSCHHRSRATALVGGLLLLGGALNPVLSATPRVGDLAVEGDTILATVTHPGSGLLAGRLVVTYESAGKRGTVEVPFRVFGGQKIFVRAQVPASVDRIIHAGIIVDDGAPI